MNKPNEGTYGDGKGRQGELRANVRGNSQTSVLDSGTISIWRSTDGVVLISDIQVIFLHSMLYYA